MRLEEEEYLAHYGILRKSGRYPWGSGGNAKTGFKRSPTFLDDVTRLRREEGMSDKQIADGFGISQKELRDLKTIARAEAKQDRVNQAQRLRDKGMSLNAIAERMGLPGDSSVRDLLKPNALDRTEMLKNTSDMLRREVEKKGAVDVGTDVYRSISLNDNPSAQIGVSSTLFDTAVAKLREEGYKIHTVNVPQATIPGQFTKTKVLAKPDVLWKDLVNDTSLIKPLTDHSPDGGRTSDGGVKPPLNVSSNRLKIVYGPEGGAKEDGLIYVRRNVSDLSMGGSNYAQVRIAIDGTHYLKGMAIYKDDLPPGSDLVFHTSKSNTGNKLDALKKLEKDPDLPFGSVIKPGSQIKDAHGKVISAINKVNEEGDWDTWSRNLPSQFLGKQSPKLVKSQLDLTYERRRQEFDEITSLTNAAVRKRLLESFSEETDSAAVHLKAAAMPRQATKVIVPIRSIKESEVFCPSLTDGTRVALVRFPHGGTFEIPQVTVNNRNREARKILGTSNPDAIGIHHKVAERLSGADFDGDTVLAIPNNRHDVQSTPALSGLKGFDPKEAYKPYDGMKTVDGGRYNAKTREVDFPIDPKTGKPKKPNTTHMQQLMGDVSNLITDMTLRGANADELAQAVRHSMVVIDCEKHHLDYKKSRVDNGIPALKARYQGLPTGSKNPSRAGASTLLSRAGSPKRIPKRKPRPAAEGGPIDRATGRKVFVPIDEPTFTKNGRVFVKTQEERRLAIVDNAHELSSGGNIENIYADHSNRLKALANDARKEFINTPNIRMSESAKHVYSNEVASLNAKLNIARKNAPRERQAQAVAAAIVRQKLDANPYLEKADKKKISNQALAEARVRCNAKKNPVTITDREWEAIQAGAISNNMLVKVLRETNIEDVRKLATPRTKVLMTPVYTARAKTMLDSGFTQAEVADALGVSVSTLKASLQGGE